MGNGTILIIHIADAPAQCKKYCDYNNHEEESGKLEPLLKRCAIEGITLIFIMDVKNASKK